MRYFIDHSKHKSKDKETCSQCRKELENLREDCINTRIDDAIEREYHRHGDNI